MPKQSKVNTSAVTITHLNCVTIAALSIVREEGGDWQ